MNATIKTKRLRLRPFRMDDADVLHHIFTDAQVRKYLLDDEIVPMTFTLEEIRNSQASFEENGYGLWAILPRDTEEIIGFCGYRPFFDPPELQILYGLLPAFWGEGYAVEAAKAVIHYGFETVRFKEIIGATDPPNKASMRVMERAGMSFDKRVTKNGAETIYYKITSASFK